jgi:hypothetical protein
MSGTPRISSAGVPSVFVVGEVSPVAFDVSVAGGAVGPEVEHAAAKMLKIATRSIFRIIGFGFIIRLAPKLSLLSMVN